MKTLVFDIETVGLPWLELDPLVREWLTRGAEDGESYRSKKEWRSLSPYAAKVIVIAALNPDTGHGKVWYEAPEVSTRTSHDGLFEEIGGDEKTLLSGFWETASKFDRLVSFNGRSFDGPFLSVRSAIYGVPPSRNLAGYRYSVESHVDLMEILTFQGAAGTRPTLHAACVAFGIPSPKSAEMHGYAVGDAYAEGRLPEILDYCRRDVDATAELLRRLEPTLLPLFRR